MHAPSNTRRSLALAGAGLLATASPAYAQSTEAANDTPNGGEIVVTASRRSETVIETPLSVTALTSADLAKLNATQFADFANTVPGLGFTTQGAGRTTINLRGVTTGIDVGPTVGIYVDDVPYGSSAAFGKGSQLALDVGLFDLDRIEVLRGPQGTLYGASSVGGVLKYVTQTPSLTQFAGTVSGGVSGIRYGDINYNGSAVVNLPIVSDKVAVRASGFYSRIGGYIDNLGTGEKDVDGGKVYGGRIDVLLKPANDLTIRLTGFGQNVRRNGGLYAGFTLGGDPVNGSLQQNHPLSEAFDSDFRLVSGSIAYKFAGATLTSITSYQHVKNRSTSDASAVYAPLLQSIGLPIFAAAIRETDLTKKFTQELRLASSGDKPIEWLVGGFYTHEKSSALQIIDSFGPDGTLLPIDIATLLVPSTYKEYAAFGDVTWHLTDKFDVTGGVRYAHNDQDFEQIATGILISSSAPRSSSESVFTYLANARYRFSDNVTAYARFATGYRPGGPNYLVLDPITGAALTGAAYDADKLKSYELGLKGETADRTFGFDLSAYLIDWKNIQIASAINGVAFIDNAGDARIKGAELTLTARPNANLTATAAFAYNDGYLTEANAALGAAKGERLPNAPHFTAAITADYVMLESDVKPSFGLTLRHVGKRTASFDGNLGLPQYRLPDYVTVDLRTGATLGPVQVQLYVHNMFDKRGQLGAATALSSFGGPAQVSILQPRTFGMSGTTSF